MIRTNGLTRRFGALTALDGLTLTVPTGELFALVGPDGAGKTTTMRLLAGILDPTAGEAFVAGKHTVREAAALKHEIAYMSQRFGLYPDLTVEENLKFYADLYGVTRREREQRLPELLSFSYLTPFRDRQAGRLSGGMKQKLGLACALIHTPRVLFLDEPTNGVDPVSRRDFWRILYRLLAEGTTIFVSTAYLDEAERCARVGLLHQGRLLACGTPDEVKRLLRGTLWGVRAAQPRAAAALLKRELAGRATVGLFGTTVHVVTALPDAPAAIGAVLAAAGEPFDAIEREEPTLEDVFVSVIGEQAA
ncbi:MAG TPA: ABC transporter ATP-binding protein [bacterium]|nr:ABC transporter ATP-binding protein [bacterium]